MTTLYNQFDDHCPMMAPSLEKEYCCSNYVKSTGLTLLMKLVLQTKKKPELENKIKIYLKKNPDQINKQNSSGHTALLLAAFNTNTVSTENTVRILIDAGADPNIADNIIFTPIMHCFGYVNTDCTKNTVQMLIDAGANFNFENGHHVLVKDTTVFEDKEYFKLLLNLAIKENSFDEFYDFCLKSKLQEDSVFAETIEGSLLENYYVQALYSMTLPHIMFLVKYLTNNRSRHNLQLMERIIQYQPEYTYC